MRRQTPAQGNLSFRHARLTTRGSRRQVEGEAVRRRLDQNRRASLFALPCGSDPSASPVRSRGGRACGVRIGEHSRRASLSSVPILPCAQAASRLYPGRRCTTFRRRLHDPCGVRGGWRVGLRLNSPSTSRSEVADWRASVFFGFPPRTRRIPKRSVAKRDGWCFTSAANRTRQHEQPGRWSSAPDCSGRDAFDKCGISILCFVMLVERYLHFRVWLLGIAVPKHYSVFLAKSADQN